ncbi:MAG: 4Fe-4S binding protein [Deltaproteobacteria bacterium]|nr:4Fe-4S binding protein [Deltaproteobacteria bacterium]MBN2672075.1 4Fe-4S binding protein [Deltaproteobacteria bacterium]
MKWKKFIESRRVVQAAVGVSIYIAVAQYSVPLSWIIVGGSAIGIVTGKIFCRWMCPMGFIMESMMGGGGKDSKMQAMYMYFKVGCPIAWISGLLNKVSLLKVSTDKSACTSCGKCDSVCYIAANNDDFSLYKPGLKNSSSHYSCSRCLNCVAACNKGALSFLPNLHTEVPSQSEGKPAKAR